ncbi:hypothetical protein GF406_00890 [candidate division KSB1 bacterium]|nr:hypothetical protein [candidate division KSB1 bacterium]
MKSKNRTFVIFFILSVLVWLIGFLDPVLSSKGGHVFSSEIPEIEINKMVSVKSVSLNNTFVCLKICINGLCSFGLYSLFCLLLNGYVLGNYAALMRNLNVPTSIILKATLPHFLEYIALWLSGAVGLNGIIIFFNLIRGKPIVNREQVRFLLKVIGIIFILVIISAYAEVRISLELILEAIK